MTRLFFSNTANQLSLTAGVLPSDTVLLFSGTATGWPATPCKGVIDPDTAIAEVVLITGTGPNSFTVVRGQDGTTAQNHSSGAFFEHRWSAAEANEANLHANLNGSVHGITGDVVGDDDVQTLSNKTLAAPLINSGVAQASASAPALVEKANVSGAANIVEWQSAAGVRLSRIGQHGELEVNVDLASVSPLILKMAASQTADGIQLRKSDNSIPFKVDKDGNISGVGLTASGAASLGAVSAPSVAATGAVTAATVTATGNVVGNNLPQVTAANKGLLIQKGTVAVSMTASNNDSGTITFPQAFSSATGVVVTLGPNFGSNFDIVANLQTVPTTTSVGWRAVQKDGNNFTGTGTIHWIAVGPA